MTAATGITGVQKAAILMLALGEDHCAELFTIMQASEIREISTAMSTLSTIPAETVEMVCGEFAKSFDANEVLIGGFDATERLLKKALPEGQVVQIMDEIRGPSGRTMWDKLGNVPEGVLANYLRNEYPQTAAVILSRLQSSHAARIMTILPEEFAVDIMMRMLTMDGVQQDVLTSVENTLKSEFIANLPISFKKDGHEILAEMLKNMEGSIEAVFMGALEKRSMTDAEKVKSLMFTFEDIKRLSPETVMRILRDVDREKLPMALKGASESVRQLFLSSMTVRAGKILQDDMAALGPVRVRDVDAAQAEVVNSMKFLASQGEIEISSSSRNDEMIQ